MYSLKLTHLVIILAKLLGFNRVINFVEQRCCSNYIYWYPMHTTAIGVIEAIIITSSRAQYMFHTYIWMYILEKFEVLVIPWIRLAVKYSMK